MKPLNKTSDVLVLDFINEKNSGANLDLSKIILGTPVENTGDDKADRNTAMDVKARKNSGYIGDQGVTYNRLDGEKLFLNVTAYIDVKTPKTTTDLLPKLNEQYGLKLTADDIVPAAIPDNTNPPVTNPEDPDPAPVDHEIVFKDDCYAFLGKIPVKIGAKPQVGERLSLVITQTQLDGLVYPDTPVEDKGQAYIYSYGVDCSAIGQFLDVQATGVMANDTAFAVELNKVVPELWVAEDASKDYNLKGANVTYVGLTADDGTGKPVEGANTAYNKVMLLELDDTKCSNFTGTMFLHFNA
ncbi:virion structural protein [Erwinia phage vB_EamM_Asesino]|uniref:Virion structural protein n=1 Tax=Erwinia phage vB_EamM_Asesino TaxID=1883370 RepID=A0A1B2IAA0_9CAUD|nr:virion structural protein [Erwinia phage vB_EamM_Asesino]ANZ48171.1 putative virion structural protein [Erwinia phage vB_EamM_Asesino]